VPLALAQANQYAIKKQGGIGGVLGNTFWGGGGSAKGSMTNHAFILERDAYLGFYVGGMPHVPKI
jgi:hypothetical protein